LNRLLKPNEYKEKPRIKPTNLPPLPSFLDDVGGTSLGRNKAGKAANEMKLRCTEFDKDGKVTLMDGEFKKTELIAKVWTAGMGQHAETVGC
jgi:magnesium transporter